jgi:two-component system phosphate regulon sensor histidine kinase PhoR
MNDVRYKWILYIIVIVILSTIGIQVYWNYKNYLSSKQQLINDVQVSLDKAVDDYYANLAERSAMAFAFESANSRHFLDKNGKLDSIVEHINFSGHAIDSIHLNLIKGVSVLKGPISDSIFEFEFRKNKLPIAEKSKIDVIEHIKTDSLDTAKFRTLTSKVVISLTRDSLSLKEIDSLLKIELLRKNLNIDYSLNYKDFKDSIRTHNGFKVFKFSNDSLNERHLLKTTSESTFLPRGSSLTINFTNETQIILKRIFGGILISFLLVLAVMSSLFYLLHIIKHQKQVAEVKNDLISNITHEFKTPIATISVALESIKDFKIIEDKDKTKKYLEISSGQLKKLNEMVEKLLETATLDSDSLTLVKESINIVEVLKTLVEKHQMLPITIETDHKTIVFSSPSGSIMASVDVFHFENAINNVLDNALKYGGKEIKVGIEQNSFAFTVSIIDNGNTITKAHKDKIFEKFYRIPKGNTHDVKGFGIGLYYTKKIVEKHGGIIHLNLEKNLTTFKLSFPNE